MNCKKDDIAFVRGVNEPAYIGRIVTVMRFIGMIPYWPKLGPCWWVRPEGWTPPDCVLNDGLFVMPDDLLRPINGGSAEDETLTWAGKPEAVTA